MLPSELRVTAQDSSLNILGPVQLTQGSGEQQGSIVHEGCLSLIFFLFKHVEKYTKYLGTSHIFFLISDNNKGKLFLLIYK
jgi:hypothetical protein